MLKPEEIPGLDNGLVVFVTGVTSTLSGAAVCCSALTSFFSGAFSGIFISCFSLRNGARIRNFFF